MTYPPGTRPRGDVTRIVCAIIGALALVVVLVVVAATDGSADTGSAQTGGSSAPVAGGLGASSDADRGGSGNASGAPSTRAAPVRAAQLRASFPFPPGTQVWSERVVSFGAKAYKVPSKNLSLTQAKAFYSRHLPALGVPINYWHKDIGGPQRQVRGWFMAYERDTEPRLYVSVALDGLELPGYVTILVSIGCQPLSESTAC